MPGVRAPSACVKSGRTKRPPRLGIGRCCLHKHPFPTLINMCPNHVNTPKRKATPRTPIGKRNVSGIPRASAVSTPADQRWLCRHIRTLPDARRWVAGQLGCMKGATNWEECLQNMSAPVFCQTVDTVADRNALLMLGVRPLCSTETQDWAIGVESVWGDPHIEGRPKYGCALGPKWMTDLEVVGSLGSRPAGGNATCLMGTMIPVFVCRRPSDRWPRLQRSLRHVPQIVFPSQDPCALFPRDGCFHSRHSRVCKEQVKEQVPMLQCSSECNDSPLWRSVLCCGRCNYGGWGHFASS